jgi:hypothetical protein
MGLQESGPTLEGLAERLEALERENATLRRQVATLENSETEQGAEPTSDVAEEKVSRRALLGKAAAAAVAATAAGTLLSPREAKAETFSSVVSTSFVKANTYVEAHQVIAQTDSQFANDVAVYGTNLELGAGVRGDGGHNGVRGIAANADGYGVEGAGDTGVHGQTFRTGYSGVYGLHRGTLGFGVVGDGTGTGGSGVLGRNAEGAGVEARASRYGGKFDGSRAQLVLVPKTSTGRPTTGTHAKGEIYMDSAGTLFVCTKGGTSGTWRKVTTTAA